MNRAGMGWYLRVAVALSGLTGRGRESKTN